MLVKKIYSEKYPFSIHKIELYLGRWVQNSDQVWKDYQNNDDFKYVAVFVNILLNL